MQPVAAAARRNNKLRRRPALPGFLGAWFVRSLEPPPKMKAKAPKNIKPRTSPALADAPPAFLSSHAYAPHFLPPFPRRSPKFPPRQRPPRPRRDRLPQSLHQRPAFLTRHRPPRHPSSRAPPPLPGPRRPHRISNETNLAPTSVESDTFLSPSRHVADPHAGKRFHREKGDHHVTKLTRRTLIQSATIIAGTAATNILPDLNAKPTAAPPPDAPTTKSPTIVASSETNIVET